MEEGAIDNPHERTQMEMIKLAMSETLPSTSHPQRASSGQAIINQQKSSSFPSFPTALDQGASSIQQQPYVSNFESDRQVANASDHASLQALWPLFIKLKPSLSSLLQDLANWDAARFSPAPNFDKPQESFSFAKTCVSNFESDRQVADAADHASLESLWPLFVKLQPSLSSLLQDLANWDAARFSPAPNFDKPQESSSYAKTSQELEQIVSLKPSSSEDFGNERNRIPGERTVDEYRALCGPLLQAAIKGDWLTAKTFLEKYPHCVRAPITKEQGTALHNAVVAQRTTFIKELLKRMTPEDLELRTTQGVTALHFVAQSGIVRIAEQLVKINNKPLLIHDCCGRKPLLYAVDLGHANMVSYLFSVTHFQHLSADERIRLLLGTIYYDMHDIAVKILEMDPTIHTECGWIALDELARKAFAIGSESQLSFWKSRLNSCLFAFNPNLASLIAEIYNTFPN